MKVRNCSVQTWKRILTGWAGFCLAASACSEEHAEIAARTAALKAMSPTTVKSDSPNGIPTILADAPTHSLCEFAVYSSSQSQLRDHTTVSGGLVGTSGSLVEIGADSTVNSSIESMNTVTLRSRAHINGDVRAVGDINYNPNDGVVVTGSVLPHVSVNPASIPAQTFTCNAAGTTAVERNQTLTLVPGSYSNVVVRAGGRLVLQAGQYTFNSLRFESGGASDHARLDITAISEDMTLRTCGELYFGNFLQTTLLAGTAASRLKFYSNTNGMVTIGTDLQFYGTVTAPAAEVHAYSRAVLNASLYGREVWIEPNSQITGLGCPVPPVAFDPVKPPTCPTTLDFDWNYRIGGTTGVFDLPSDPNCTATPGNPCPHYINNLNNSRWFVSNTWVGYIAYRVSAFSTESSSDFLKWGLESIPLGSISGSVSSGTRLWSNTSWSFGGVRDALDFMTNGSNTYGGAYLDQVQVCTYLNQIDTHPPNTFDLKRRYNGILLGTNDVVYLKFAATSTNHYSITLWDDMEGAGNDFDLYGRCGSLPTPTQYDWRGYSTDSQEYIEASNCNDTVYVAVHSYAGTGIFSTVLGIHSPGNHTNLRAGTTFNATDGQLATFRTSLQRAMRHFYGSTEGEQVIGQVDLYNSQNCSIGSSDCDGSRCDICFNNIAGRSNGHCAAWGTAGINLFPTCATDGECISHEMGHFKYCVFDEYYDPPSGGSSIWQCGHSNMASPWGNNNNFCVDSDHKTDKDPAAPASTLASVMSAATAAGTAIDSENVTFDNFDYEDFDFNSLVGNVVQH